MVVHVEPVLANLHSQQTKYSMSVISQSGPVSLFLADCECSKLLIISYCALKQDIFMWNLSYVMHAKCTCMGASCVENTTNISTDNPVLGIVGDCLQEAPVLANVMNYDVMNSLRNFEPCKQGSGGQD